MAMGVSISKFAYAAVTTAALLVLQGGALSGQPVVRSVSLSPPLPGSGPVGVWTGNALAKIEGPESSAPVLHFYDESGAEVERVTIQVPGAHSIQVLDKHFARSADGVVAAAGFAYGLGDRGANFLAIIGPDRASQTVVRTTPYVTDALTIASDGTIWTAGWEFDDRDRDKAGESYFVIRRFNRQGKLLGGAAPRTEFPGRWSPSNSSQFAASQNRVGWFSTVAHKYMEFSLDGKEIGTYSLPVSHLDIQGVALCDDNSAWFSAHADLTVPSPTAAASASSVISVLDRAHGTWVGGGRTERWVYVYGCSGTQLVTTSAWTNLDWREARQGSTK